MSAAARYKTANLLEKINHSAAAARRGVFYSSNKSRAPRRLPEAAGPGRTCVNPAMPLPAQAIGKHPERTGRNDWR
ncbi:hypothetical protein LQT98_09915 [Chromobacterium aquaticum]|uniref:hypothetical protein n=1 Tax=Chromobacterium TaxID=535 RepID=UPI0012E1BABF|nr:MULTISPECIES: hypothetical protein [Chromobacterium]MCD5361999.1 hypothetical protein [Chromobacterium aquaticum]